ncbi:MAG: rRNA maturation RNase YbeY [Vicinamibacteraceae bacterium]
MASGPGSRLAVTVCDAAGGPVRVPGLAAWLAGLAPRAATGTLTLVITSDRRIRRLNRLWRGIDKATDVLSFPAGDDPGPVRHLGDVVISRETAVRQARDGGHPLATELRVLALHGLLHLLGYDHERDSGQMARFERRLRRQGNLPAGLIERQT